MASVIGYLEMVQAHHCLINLLLLKIFHHLKLHPLINISFILLESCMYKGKRTFLTNMNITLALSSFHNIFLKECPSTDAHSIPLFIYFTLPPYLNLLYLTPNLSISIVYLWKESLI